MDFLYLLCNAFVFRRTGAELSRMLLVITGSGNMDDLAQRFYRIPPFLGTLADRFVLPLIAKLPQSFPLSNSFTFLTGHSPFSANISLAPVGHSVPAAPLPVYGVFAVLSFGRGDLPARLSPWPDIS